MPMSLGRAVTLHTPDGLELPAWAALPEGPLRGAVVVVQEIFGVNSHIRAVTERFAARGFAALAPALFHRLEPQARHDAPMGIELGYTADDVQKGRSLKSRAEALPGDLTVAQDLCAAVDWLAEQTGQKVGMVGFCWGGLLTWRAAALLPQLSAAVSYYGGGMTLPEERARTPQCPVMAHFGREDAHIPLDGVIALSQAHPGVQVHVYEAGHGFNCDQRPDYDDASAVQAKDRTLAFFDQYLGRR